LLDGSGILLMSERVLKMKQVLGDQRRVWPIVQWKEKRRELQKIQLEHYFKKIIVILTYKDTIVRKDLVLSLFLFSVQRFKNQ
jgi:hypothetical protein